MPWTYWTMAEAAKVQHVWNLSGICHANLLLCCLLGGDLLCHSVGQKTKVLHWLNRVTSLPTGKHIEPTWGSWVVSSLACKLLRKVRSCGKRVWVLFAVFGGTAGGTQSLPRAREVLHSYTSRSSSHLWAGRFWRALLLPACQESLGCKVHGGGSWGVCEWVQLNGLNGGDSVTHASYFLFLTVYKPFREVRNTLGLIHLGPT